MARRHLLVLHVGHQTARRLRLGLPSRLVIATAGKVHFLALRYIGFGVRLGVVATLRLDERISRVLDVHPRLARALGYI